MKSGTQKREERPLHASKFGPGMSIGAVFLLVLWLSGGLALIGSLVSTGSQLDKFVSAAFVLIYCLISPITIGLLIYMLGIGMTLCGFTLVGTNLILASQSPYRFTQILFNTVHLALPDWALSIFVGGSAKVLLAEGRFDEADRLLREAINQIERDTGIGSDAWLRFQMYLVDCCIKRGRFDEAEERLQNCAAHPGFDGTILLSGLPNNIFLRWAELCFNRGQYSLAVQHYTRTLQALEVDETSSKVERKLIDQLRVEITIELAIMYCKAQMVDKAAAIASGVSYEGAFECVDGVLCLAKLNYVLGVVALNDGELNMCKDYLEKALSMGRQYAVLSRAEVADVTAAMAMLAEANQNNALADSLFCQALEAKKSFFGSDHPQTAYVLESYGAFLNRAGTHTKADEVLSQARNIRASIES